MTLRDTKSPRARRGDLLEGHQAAPTAAAAPRVICRRCGHDTEVILRCVATGSLHPQPTVSLKRVQQAHEAEAAREALRRGVAQIDAREAGARDQLVLQQAHELSVISMRFSSSNLLTVERYIRKRRLLEADEPVARAERLSTAPVLHAASLAVGNSQSNSRGGEYEFGGIRSPKRSEQAGDGAVAVAEPRIVARLRELGLSREGLEQPHAAQSAVEVSPTMSWLQSLRSGDSVADLDANLRQRQMLKMRMQRANEVSVLALDAREHELRCVLELREHDEFSVLFHGDEHFKLICALETCFRVEMEREGMEALVFYSEAARVQGMLMAAKNRLVADEAGMRERICQSEQHRDRQRLVDLCRDQLQDLEDVKRQLGIETAETIAVQRIRLAKDLCREILASPAVVQPSP